jgi:hypothetical protein
MLSDLIHSLADQKARGSANQYLHFAIYDIFTVNNFLF